MPFEKDITVLQVKIQVKDMNDNIPKFIYPDSSKRYKKEKYFGAISADRKEIGTPVLQVRVCH